MFNTSSISENINRIIYIEGSILNHKESLPQETHKNYNNFLWIKSSGWPIGYYKKLSKISGISAFPEKSLNVWLQVLRNKGKGFKKRIGLFLRIPFMKKDKLGIGADFYFNKVNFGILIYCDDASPDSSRAIAEGYALVDKRIRIIDNNENSGAAWSRMIGYSNALGEYITFYDPDDFVPPHALEVLYNAMIQDDAVDICIGNYQRVFPDGSKSKVYENHLKYGNDKWSVAKSTLKFETPHYLWNKMFKTALFKYPEIIAYKNFSKSSDEYLFFQVLQNCEKVISIDKLVYYYYDNHESASYNKSNLKAMKAMLISQNYIDNLYGKKEGFNSLIHKRKTSKYAHFLKIADNDKTLLKLLFNNKIDYLFTLWNLLNNFHKSKALRVLIVYLKAKIKSIEL